MLARPLLILALLLTACSDSSGSDDTATTDTGGAGQLDAGGDDAATDSALDTGTADVTPDAAPDTAPDVAPDAFTGVCGDGACEGPEDARSCAEDCTEAPVFLHLPGSGRFLSYPDDFYTEPDADTVTGLRVTLSRETVPEINDYPALVYPVFDALAELDGFGTSAGAFIRFTRPLDPDSLVSGAASVEVESPVIFGYLEGERFVRQPVELLVTDEDSTIIARPMLPLPPATHAVMAVTRAARGADGVTVEPNHVLRRLLDGQESGDPALDRLIPRVSEAVAAMTAQGAIDGGDDLAALLVFTTQSIVEESLAMAEVVRERPHAVLERQGCEDEGAFRTCRLTFEARNFRDPERGLVVPDEAGAPDLGSYALPVVVYLPTGEDAQEAPWPVAIFGHGLSGDKTQAQRLAEFAAPRGWVTIAIDAPEHGEHPQRNPESGGGVFGLLDFFGISGDGGVDAAALRDNWRQAALDKLALIELLKAGLDADGDGAVESDGARIFYLGASLGGIMGPELLALTPDIAFAGLSVAGGRVTDIVQFGEAFVPLIELFTPADTPPGDLDRFWPVMQTVVDRGDAVNYAPYLLRDRLVGDPVQLLSVMVVDDDTVPEPTNLALARAVGAPAIPPIYREIGVIPTLESGLPLRGNLADGGTAGFMQIKWITRSNGDWRRATHSNVTSSDVGIELWLNFFDGALREGVGVIVDPYASLGLEPPPE